MDEIPHAAADSELEPSPRARAPATALCIIVNIMASEGRTDISPDRLLSADQPQDVSALPWHGFL
ncbi:hypothetical protein CLG96_11325 [Sphingomonas oleivorans]|uniref:Uncharacterized protein n=1 Tax=Sphingomonas oleivorans TaxID=1735121 RepID=A0A2T5FXV8_9SPHN|nr:hypothetical protein CLG96_11325 [Sphingomonas oleivorans]